MPFPVIGIPSIVANGEKLQLFYSLDYSSCTSTRWRVSRKVNWAKSVGQHTKGPELKSGKV